MESSKGFFVAQVNGAMKKRAGPWLFRIYTARRIRFYVLRKSNPKTPVTNIAIANQSFLVHSLKTVDFLWQSWFIGGY